MLDYCHHVITVKFGECLQKFGSEFYRLNTERLTKSLKPVSRAIDVDHFQREAAGAYGYR
jgi:hypothetical protein